MASAWCSFPLHATLQKEANKCDDQGGKKKKKKKLGTITDGPGKVRRMTKIKAKFKKT